MSTPRTLNFWDRYARIAPKYNKTDANGSQYQSQRVVTSASQLCGLVTPGPLPGDRCALVLCDFADGVQAQSAINCYRIDTGELVRSILVEKRGGFMAISSDGEILAVGAMKEDTIMVFHVRSGDHLCNVSGNLKTGYWGTLNFLPNNINALVEERFTHKSKRSVVRVWDLGFRSHPSTGQALDPLLTQPASAGNSDKPTEEGENVENAGHDHDEGEDGVKLWECVLEGNSPIVNTLQGDEAVSPGLNLDNINANVVVRTEDSHSMKVLLTSAIDLNRPSSGDVMLPLVVANPCSESWSTKIVLSKNKRFFAIGHFGRCSVMSCATGELVGEVFSPVADDTYPMVPLAFALDDDSLLICRVNLTRMLVLRTWRDQSMSYIVRDVGGTISDASAMAPDGLTLLCWPYGSVEMYNTGMMISDMYRKYRVATVWACIRLRALFAQERVTEKTRSSPMSTTHEALLRLSTISADCVFQYILEFI